MTIDRPNVGARVELTIKDRDGSTAKIAGTLRRSDAWSLAERLTEGAAEFLRVRAKGTLMPPEGSQ